MTDDIVTRLRVEAAQCNASPCDCQCPNLIAAADEIERLREQVQYRDDVISMLRSELAKVAQRTVIAESKEARRG